MNLKRTIDILQNSKKKFLVVGDLMLDEYVFSDVDRISPEAPVPVAKVRERKFMLGGCGNVQKNLRTLGGEVFTIAVVGQDIAGKRLSRMMTSDLVFDFGRKTSIKRRIIAHSQQLLRIDEETSSKLSVQKEQEIIRKIKKYIDKVDVVVLSDYAKGVLTDDVLRFVISQCNERGVPIVLDPKREDYSAYRGSILVTPNEKEAFLVSNTVDTELACRFISENFNINQVLITRGEDGMTFLDGQKIYDISTKAEYVYNVTGAGDTVVALMSLGIANNADMIDCVHLANIAASIVIEKVGTVAPSWDEILRRVE